MSRSTKKPIFKQKPRNYKRTTAYWRPIRSRINQIVRGYKNRYIDTLGMESDWVEDLEIYLIDSNLDSTNFIMNQSEMLGTDIPNPKTIIDDYVYCDYWWDFTNPRSNEKNKIKYSRK